MSTSVYKKCVGPDLEADTEKCIQATKPGVTGWAKLGMFEIPATGDGASYNGIRNWRCPVCFYEHRKRLREFRESFRRA